MGLNFGSKTDVGLKRRNNQDNLLVVRGENLNGELDALFVIADGMGGRQGGEIASEIVVKTLSESVMAHLAQRNGDKSPVDTAFLLETAVRDAHRKVKQRQAADEQLSGMGTTCVAAILDANELTLANVGDSRAYLLRGGRLKQMTQDHSSVWEQVQAGQMTPEEARTSRFRNQITRAIGSDFNAKPDIFRVELQAGDSVLLCSDGLYSEVNDDDMARLFAGVADPQAACENLVERALAAGGRDNVSVIALRYGDFTPVALENRARPAALPAIETQEEWGNETLSPPGEEPYEFQAALKGGRRPPSPVLLGLTFLLAVVAGGEGYALMRLNQDYTQLRKAPPKIISIPPDRPTDHALDYGTPLVMAPNTVRSIPLAVDTEGGVLAASTTGNLVRIDHQGHVTRFLDQANITGSKPLVPGRPSLLIATDVSGNRYQVNPGVPAISKYDAEGALKADDIGKDALVAPTALAVDSLGNLFVIDEHQVKKIAATESAQPPAASQSAR